MINTQFFEDLTQQIARLLPQAGAASEEVKKTVNAVLQKGFASLDLLTRQEFEGEMARLEALLEKPVKP